MDYDDEHELVERCRRGNNAAWAELYRRYAPGVTAYVRGTLGPCADVEDLVQHVFLELLRSLPRYRGEAGLNTWLHRIASNVLRKQRRSWWRFRRKIEAYADEMPTSTQSPEGPESAADARGRLRQVSEALEAMSVEFRMTWVLVEIEGMGVEDAAHVLGVKPATVRTRHHRARQRIREHLDRLDLRASNARRRSESVSAPLTERVEVAP